jgi:hypothetical protein
VNPPCVQNPSLFDVDATPRMHLIAADVCAICPIRQDCLAAAMASMNDLYPMIGVLGGYLFGCGKPRQLCAPDPKKPTRPRRPHAEHGTRWMYMKDGCRCASCVSVARKYGREHKAQWRAERKAS